MWPFAWNPKPASPRKRLLVTLLLVAAATVLRLLCFGALGKNIPFLLFFPALTLAALYGGLRTGLLATALSAGLVIFWIDKSHLSPTEWLSLAIFTGSGALISTICELMRRSNAQEKLIRQEAEITNKQLRREMAERLRVEEKFRKLFNHAEVGMIRTRLDGSEFLDVNDKFLAILETTREELLGQPSSAIWADPAEREEIAKRLKTEGKVVDFECRMLTRTGNVRTCLTSVTLDPETGILEGSAIDITERKEAAAALAALAQRNQTLLQAATEGIHVLDEQGNVVDVNPAFCRMLGYTREEVLRLKVADWDDQWSPAELQLKIRELLANPTTTFETRHRTKDGTIREVEISAVGITLENKKYIYAAARDITERKRSEATLRESERFNQATLDALSAQVAVLDESGKIVATNQAWREFAGVNSTDWKSVSEGTNYLAACEQAAATGDRDATKTMKGIREVANGARRVWDYEYTCHSPTEQRWFHCIVTRFPGDGPVRVVVAHENITKRKLAEAAHARLAMAVDQAAETIVITDPDGNILYANPAFEKTTGYNRAEVVGQNPRVLKSGKQDAEFYRHMWETIKRGEIWKGHFANKRKDGSLYEEEAIISPVRDADGKIINFVAVKRDVTNEIKLEKQFRQSQKMEAIGTLAGGVAHDFNNLLAVLQIQASLLKITGTLSPEQTKLADEISNTVTRGSDLTRQLLLFGRKGNPQPRDLELNQTITNLTQMLRRVLTESIEVKLQLAGKPLFVHADAGMLDQVLMNLAVNAGDAMPKGGQLVIGTTDVEFDEAAAAQSPPARPGAFVCLSVSDTGSGIPPEILSRIFEPFFTTKPVSKGTGLGLATVFGIVELHRGWIKVASEVGHGTTFKIYLPRLAGQTNQQIAQQLSSARPTGNETILLVEDEPVLRNSIRKTLAQLGYQVREAPTGVEALKVWQEHREKIHLLLTDMVMPGGLTGKELAERLLQENPKLKVIYMSGYSLDLTDPNLALKAGVNFLNKPFQIQQLAQTLRARLDEPTVG